jgi:hypothetical protein
MYVFERQLNFSTATHRLWKGGRKGEGGASKKTIPVAVQ